MLIHFSVQLLSVIVLDRRTDTHKSQQRRASIEQGVATIHDTILSNTGEDSMSQHDHEHGYALNQAKRFWLGQVRARLSGARVRQRLTYITTLCTMFALLFATMGGAWARPLLAVAPSLGTATSFGVLAGSTATNIGPTSIVGDLGVNPGNAITGFPPGVVIGGTTHAADAVALQAQLDVTAAYNDLAGQACDADLTSQDLAGLTLTPGVYCFSTSAQLTGALTLDGQGDPSAVFIFKIGSTLTTASSASVLTINGASGCNVFWQVGSSATLGTNTAFAGNMLALASITLNTSASLFGRALAQTGAVTMDSNNISTLCTLASPTNTPAPTATDSSGPATNTPESTVTNEPGQSTSTQVPVGPGTPTGNPALTATPDLTLTGTPTPESALVPPTGLEPISEPSASTSKLYLPFVVN